jgi:hypothetical protein
MTSSLIQSVSKSSRAIRAVVTASRTLWHPAVLGRTGTPRPRMMSQKGPPWPPAASRRNETVATPAPERRKAASITDGEGYCAVPSIRGEAISVP